MHTLETVNRILLCLFFVCYAYQFLYIPVPWLWGRRETPPTPGENDFAVLICARNEQAVIGDLIASLRGQTYDARHIHIFVLADNCTDDTALFARCAGAVVYERRHETLVGKGYALSALLGHLQRDYPEGFDGYFVFDADNLLRPDYIERMNETFSQGNEIVTSYRNSKNYADSWISAGCALWFLRESRYLNHARSLLGVSCAVGGTGFLFSRAVAEEMGTWPYHTLTEDIEFSVSQICAGRRIAFCTGAELYDEQPADLRQSWRQRMRWAKGYLQVIACRGGELLRGMLRGSFSCYDMAMSIMPAFILSLLSIACHLALGVWGAVVTGSVIAALASVGRMLLGMYLTLFLLGAVTTASEWRRIRTTAAKKLLYTLTFPLFMLTYIPIALSALFCKVEWKPIAHRVSVTGMRARRAEELLPLQDRAS